MLNYLKNLLENYNVDKIKSMSENDIDNFVLEIVLRYKKSDLFLYYMYLLDNSRFFDKENRFYEEDIKIEYLLKNKSFNDLNHISRDIMDEKNLDKYNFLYVDIYNNTAEILKIYESEEYKELVLEKLL